MVLRSESKTTVFLNHSDGVITERSSVDLPGVGRAAPYSPDNNLIQHGVVLFPSTASEYGSDELLLDEIRGFIHRYADVSPGFEEIASLYVLFTWIYERSLALPYLRLKGEYGTGKSRCLQVIGSVCYKPMFVSGASTVSPVFRIIDAFRGTLILDESDFRQSDDRAQIIKILNNGNAAGFPVLRSEVTATREFSPRAFGVFGPKLIATHRSFDDQALESRCITEVMTGLPPRRDIPLALPASFDCEALVLRNKLLMYRFRNLRNGQYEDRLRDTSLEPRIAQMLSVL